MRGFGANAFGSLVTVAIQIVSVPVFLRYWGPITYGTWLVLSAIPAYLVMSDLGFGNVAANEMTMQVARGERDSAREIFQSTWVFTVGVSIVVAGIAALAISFLPIGRWIHSSGISGRDVSLIIIAFVVQVLFVLQGTLIGAGFRCEGEYALSTVYSNLTRAGEAAAVMGAVVLGARPSWAAFIFLAARALLTLITAVILVRRHKWLSFGVASASVKTLRRLAAPAFAFMAFPLGSAMSLQGFVALVGIVLGPVAVVTFATLRTLSRVGFQLMAVINNAVWPEVSASMGRGDFVLTRKLHRSACQLAIWAGFLVVGVLWASGSTVVRIWTHGRVHFDASLFHGLLIVVIANSFWFTSSVVLLAGNLHRKLALVYLSATTCSLIVGYLVLPRFGLVIAPAVLLIVDAFTIPFVLKQSLAITRDSLADFLKAVLKPPSLQYLVGQVNAVQVL